MKKGMGLTAVALLLAGCGPVELPVMHKYALTMPVKTIKQAPKTNKTLVVAVSMAEPGYRSKGMVYTQTPYELKQYSQSRWVAPPSKMLGSMVVNALQQAHYFQAVTSPAVGSQPNYQLNVHLDSLQQSFLKSSSYVHLAVTVTLIDVKSSRVIAARTYVKEVTAPENNAYAGVVAANQAAEWVATRVADFARQFGR